MEKLTRQELEKWSKDELIDYIFEQKQFWLEILQSFNPKVKKDENDANLFDDSLIVKKCPDIIVTNEDELLKAIKNIKNRKIIIFNENKINYIDPLTIPREASIGPAIVRFIKNKIEEKKNEKGGKIKHGRRR